MSHWPCEHCGRVTPVPWVETHDSESGGTSRGPALSRWPRCIHCGKNPTSYSRIWAFLFIAYFVLMLLWVFVSGDTVEEADGDKVTVVWVGGFMLMGFMCLLLGKLKVKLRLRRAIRQERARQRKAEQGRQNNE